MLILELGILIIPFSLLLSPPCRRFVLLVSKLQLLRTAIVRSSSSPVFWNQLSRLNDMTFII
ncbi:hypothetical protein KFK09_019175 [Dendrobium nobile]|uniref:Uncharacterized protein n=1 Tax=Dendrobium nobile TaxID=94219 RepID=A0A8T3AXU6_DENNO|nr:hypothetical protein KFK09_019175 [Dendrobium nobile]